MRMRPGRSPRWLRARPGRHGSLPLPLPPDGHAGGGVWCGELGALRRVEAALCFPLPRFSDIRYQLDLAGGATMDAGCYAIHMARMLGGEEPEVAGATAKLRSDQIDRAMTAELRFPSGHRATSRLRCGRPLSSGSVPGRGASGVASAMLNPLAPQLPHRLSVTVDGRTHVQHFPRRHTYDYQLDAFLRARCSGESRSSPAGARLDSQHGSHRLLCIVAAGLEPRPMPRERPGT